MARQKKRDSAPGVSISDTGASDAPSLDEGEDSAPDPSAGPAESVAEVPAPLTPSSRVTVHSKRNYHLPVLSHSDGKQHVDGSGKVNGTHVHLAVGRSTIAFAQWEELQASAHAAPLIAAGEITRVDP